MPISAEHDDTERHLKQLTEDLETGKLAELNQLLQALTPAEIADLLEALKPADRLVVWRLLPPEVAGEVLVELHEEVRGSLIKALEKTDAEDLIEAAGALDPDDLADIVEDLPETIRDKVVQALSHHDRRRLERVLTYPEDTAGSLMRTDTITVRPNVTLDVVLRYLRQRGELPDLTDALYVVDKDDRLIGILPLSVLLTSDPNKTVRELMLTDVEAIPAALPASDVAMLFEHHDWVSAPVVDEEGRLVGRITVDDVVDVIRDEAEHTIMSQAGLSEETDMFAPISESAKRRAVWLGVNLVTAFLAAWVIGLFEATIQKEVALAVLMPIVASMGGIAGTQTQTLVIRALALKQIGEANVWTLLTREIAIGLINGVLWAIVVGIIAAIWFQALHIGLLIAAAMIINLLCAAFAGVMIPLLLDKLGIDPALAGGVVLTTVTDVVGFLAFLGLATLWLF
ncbi:magnesium transporter [Methylomarinovum caldicuralii]|uniref:Magnesium transporter MgtE n=1 Tax=Methylomarinovum caldicuralii TaxID=438856 RepID=A0AAU9CNF7_9GAMM|nr:magnesium transporter [Methylomarinovum caldicuralii]BCX81488.1 magnesium transporter [Methylomarinovum caldicuralii]